MIKNLLIWPILSLFFLWQSLGLAEQVMPPEARPVVETARPTTSGEKSRGAESETADPEDSCEMIEGPIDDVIEKL